MSANTASNIGGSIFLIALGAIFAYAVTAEVAGVSLDTIGVILMLAGGAWLLLSLIFGVLGGYRSDRTEVVHHRDGTDSRL